MRETSSSRLDTKAAIVTGGASGIGLAIAARFAREGAAVLLTDSDADAGEAAVRGIIAGGGTAGFRVVDVASEDGNAAAVAEAVERFGSLNVLVNNAGVMPTRSLQDQTTEEWDRTIAVNLRGVFLATRAAIPALRAGGAGSVINTASPSGVLGYPDLAAYSASKGGVLALTRAMAVELAPAIRVNALVPGTVDTAILRAYLENVPEPDETMAAFERQHPMGRIGTPDDVAGAALYLASDDASWVTGSSLFVDGGLSILKGNPA
ncbi:MAG: SDR family NAD(P)-dependent oxidoreductase [Solirubrobacteraceae bacterium]